VQVDEERLFEAYFRVYAARVHTFALRRIDPDAAKDVTAETFSIAWRRRNEIPAEPLPWLYGIARGVLANEQRAANRRRALAARLLAEPTPAGTAIGGDHEILEALAALRESDRESLLLSAWEGLTTREAARVMGCSAAAFAVRLHRARRRLARILDEAGVEADLVSCHDSITEVST
jgi:RNA polymerase sigma-70 factor (ECF subfamily)